MGVLITFLICGGVFIVGALWLFGSGRLVSKLCCKLFHKGGEKDFSKVQKWLFWIVNIVAFTMLILVVDLLYIYVAHFLNWAGFFVPESWRDVVFNQDNL